ncbi:MAG: penicillin-binding protein 2, partial [Dehalococcoidia bacterium]|nr:penicillin-binding protein 2 [Dehalococcoidia bacterium]
MTTAPPTTRPTPLPAARMSVTLLALGACALLLAVRVVTIQVLEHPKYLAMAQDEHWGTITVYPQRGAIRDRNGFVLAMTVTTTKVSADTTKTPPDQARRIANLLSPMINQPVDRLVALLSQPNSKPVLASGLPYATASKIALLGLPGIITEHETRRVYPEGAIASQLLGLVGRDNRGLSGLELDFNRELTGQVGRIRYERDPGGYEIPLGARDEIPAVDGADLVLTIDRYIQRVAEQEAEAAMSRNKADAVTIIVMEPATGEILALASRPSFNIAAGPLTDTKQIELLRNRPVTDMYEPGSIFKIFTMAAALNEGRVGPTTTYFDPGYVVKYGQRINNWDGQGSGWTDMTKLLIRSANVGSVFVADQLGPQLFYSYVRRFGFGEPTGVDLSGEAFGQVRDPADPRWSPFDLATNSFGQGISASSLQVVAATAAIANGGTLMQPHVVRQIRTPTGARDIRPVVVRRVISEEASRTLRAMMRPVVEEGAQKAAVPGYRLSGKSGTTQ